MATRRQHRDIVPAVFFLELSWVHVDAKLHSKSTSKLLKFSTSFRIEFWSLLGSILESFLRSNFAPRKVSKVKKPMCTKPYSFQYETMVFDLPRGSEVEEKTMPKRLQDKSNFQEARNHEKVANIGPSKAPK